MKKMLGLFLVTVLALAGCQRAEAPSDVSTSEGSYLATLPVEAANFQGTLSIDSVRVEGKRPLISGAISYLYKGEKVTQRVSDVPFTLRGAEPVNASLVPQQNRRCSLLYLDLDGLFLDLLGLQVDLSPVELSIDAVEGEDRLLGNLLCNLVTMQRFMEML